MSFACLEFNAKELGVVGNIGGVDLGVAGNRGEGLKLEFVYGANEPLVAKSKFHIQAGPDYCEKGTTEESFQSLVRGKGNKWGSAEAASNEVSKAIIACNAHANKNGPEYSKEVASNYTLHHGGDSCGVNQ
jgi:hypothetical protein